MVLAWFLHNVVKALLDMEQSRQSSALHAGLEKLHNVVKPLLDMEQSRQSTALHAGLEKLLFFQVFVACQRVNPSFLWRVSVSMQRLQLSRFFVVASMQRLPYPNYFLFCSGLDATIAVPISFFVVASMPRLPYLFPFL